MKIQHLVLVCALANFLFCPSLQAYQGSPPATLGKPSEIQPAASRLKSKNLESFDLVWKTIKDTHWDENLVGEKWSQSRDQLRPKIETAESVADARAIITELVGTLGQSHFAIIPSDSYDVVDNEKGGNADIGIVARMSGGQLLVTKVRDGSSAANAGVQTGWKLLKIRDRTADSLIEKFKKAAHGPQRSETVAGLSLEKWLSGKKGSDVSVAFEDHNGKIVDMVLNCESSPGKFAKFGHLPPIRVVDESKTIKGSIGYYRFNAFLDPIRIMPNYRKVIRDPSHSSGIVIDLRGNYGGLAAMTMGMAGEFVTEQTALGTMDMKGTQLKFVANPLAKPKTVPVAVLVDECSISSAEIFAGGLKDLGLARIFGSRTAGLALPSMIVKLPNGDGFQYAMADYHSANGQSLEVNGVEPDHIVELNRENLAGNRDPVLEAATAWIESNRN